MTMTLVVLGIAMLVTVGFTGLCSFNPGAPENGPVREVDSSAFLQMETQRADYPIREPETPEGWQPNSVRAGMAEGHTTTILGFVTANGDYVHAVQTSAPSSMTAAFHVLASSTSRGIESAASALSAAVSEGAAWARPSRARTSTRRTLVSMTTCGSPKAKEATAAAV